MFGTIQRVIVGRVVPIGLVVAATVVAIADGKVANLLIGAAMVASSLTGFGVLMNRRLGDAYDAGKHTRVGAGRPDKN